MEPRPIKARIMNLENIIESWNLPKKEEGLINPLENALKQFDKGHVSQTINMLFVFIKAVQRSKVLTEDQANLLMSEAVIIINLLR